METQLVIFYAICMMNPMFQNVGMGLQKWSVDMTPKAEAGTQKWLWIGVWILGLLAQAVVVVLGSWALTIGNASTLGGFAGLGLIALALFSHFVLKERIVKKEMIGMALIVAGTIVLGIYSHGSQSGDVHMESNRMTIFFAVYLTAVAIGIALLLKHTKLYGGAILGVIGGSMNGLGVTFQKVFMNTAMAHIHGKGLVGTILVLLASPYTYLMIVGGIGGLVVIQFGYKYGKAVQVVPGHAAMVVIIPVLAGMIILGESVPVLVLLSAVVVTVGVLITTLADPGKHAL